MTTYYGMGDPLFEAPPVFRRSALRRSSRSGPSLGSPLRGYSPARPPGRSGSRRPHQGPQRLRRGVLALFLLVIAAAALQWLRPLPRARLVPTTATTLNAGGKPVQPPWPATGEAGLAVSGVGFLGGERANRAVPIASVAKVMTAYLVLRDHPLTLRQSGPILQITTADVSTYRSELATQQSVVAVQAGEQLTETQALQALLIPSANNIAQLLARWDAGSVSAFVAKMNTAAARLGMTHTHYTDPSGFAASTVSSAADQLILAQVAMQLPKFAAIVDQPQVTLPVAGTLFNFDYQVGHDGFIGVKTGSDGAAGGCWIFAARRPISGRMRVVYGAVFGQHGAGGQLLQPALAAGRLLADASPGLLRTETVLKAGTVVGYWMAPWASRIPLRTATALSGLVLPGQRLVVRLRLLPLSGRRLPAGGAVGQLELAGGLSSAGGWRTQIVISRSAPTAGWRWRLTRLS